MMQELRDLNEEIIDALNKLQEEKLQVQKAYNKKVKKQEFMQGDLVLKAFFSTRIKNRQFGKWSPTQEGPFRVSHIYFGYAYLLESINGEIHSKTINGKYLKKYTPSI